MNVAMNGSALLSPLTGIGQYVLNLAKGLQANAEVDLDLFYGDHFSPDIKHAVTFRAGQMRALVRAVVRTAIPNAYGVHRMLHQRNFNKGVRLKPYDVYHEPNYLALRFEGPTVITVHDLSWIRFPETHPAERVKAMDRFFEPALRKAALLLTDSAFIRNEVIETFRLDPASVVSIPLGLDPLFRPMSPEQTLPVLQRLGLRHGGYFLSVGTLEPRKNMQATVAAYSRLPEAVRKRYPLVLAGMKGWHTSKLENLLRPLVDKGQVQMLGYLERSELATVMAGALTMVYPSLYEGFGLPPLEAMGCGVPPITSTASCLPEVVGDSGLSVDAADVEGLSAAMQRMVADTAMREELSARALQRSAQFTWARCVQETQAAYRRAASSSR
jgi:alpha-1,3-rhamnosyl/mannosyltransferase